MNPQHLWTDLTLLIDYASVNYIPRKSFEKDAKVLKKVSKTVKKVHKKYKKKFEKIWKSPQKSPEKA